MSETALVLDQVEKSYGKDGPREVKVLTGASLTLIPGEAVALVAPSGAGKSTLLHIAGLLDRADSGRIVIAGKDLTEASDRERTEARRRDVGFIYQFHHLLPEFNAAENIMLPQFANGELRVRAVRRTKDLLDKVGLSHRAGHRPAALSGGEQQRVAFCRALANTPKVLLADEPTGNLDPTTSETVFSALMNLVRGTGLAALVATHNPDLAARMDRTVKLEAGALTDAPFRPKRRRPLDAN